MSSKKFHLVIGASTKPERYSNIAINRLKQHGHEVRAIGLKPGEVSGVKIDTGFPEFRDVHTVTMYVNPDRQVQLYDYILGLKPERIIFNPGTENPEFESLAQKNGIETIQACTLVMLSIGNY